MRPQAFPFASNPHANPRAGGWGFCINTTVFVSGAKPMLRYSTAFNLPNEKTRQRLCKAGRLKLLPLEPQMVRASAKISGWAGQIRASRVWRGRSAPTVLAAVARVHLDARSHLSCCFWSWFFQHPPTPPRVQDNTNTDQAPQNGFCHL
jgi:hypothetical protein